MSKLPLNQTLVICLEFFGPDNFYVSLEFLGYLTMVLFTLPHKISCDCLIDYLIDFLWLMFKLKFLFVGMTTFMSQSFHQKPWQGQFSCEYCVLLFFELRKHLYEFSLQSVNFVDSVTLLGGIGKLELEVPLYNNRVKELKVLLLSQETSFLSFLLTYLSNAGILPLLTSSWPGFACVWSAHSCLRTSSSPGGSTTVASQPSSKLVRFHSCLQSLHGSGLSSLASSDSKMCSSSPGRRLKVSFISSFLGVNQNEIQY